MPLPMVSMVALCETLLPRGMLDYFLGWVTPRRPKFLRWDGSFKSDNAMSGDVFFQSLITPEQSDRFLGLSKAQNGLKS